jgi:LCP family protein required for cell wall assembly
MECGLVFKKYNFIHFNKNVNTENKNKNTKKFISRIFLFIMLILFILFITFAIIINTYLNKINKVDISINDTNKSETSTDQEDLLNQQDSTIVNDGNRLKENNDIINIALFGIDETEGIAGRSDCIMILTIDNLHKELKLSSIIRDSYVTIPNKNSKDKINHAYAFGGPKLAIETLNENFNLNIDKFITVNFSSLPKIIDDIGGITLNLTSDELEYINSAIYNTNKFNHTNSPNILTAGEQLVVGTQALAYCRIRYTEGGDFKRTERQRTVLNKLLEKSKSIPLTQYPSLLDELLPTIHTNLEKSEILSLAINLNSLRNKPILQDRFPCDEDSSGKLINGIYYYVFNKDSTAEKMHEFIFE